MLCFMLAGSLHWQFGFQCSQEPKRKYSLSCFCVIVLELTSIFFFLQDAVSMSSPAFLLSLFVSTNVLVSHQVKWLFPNVTLLHSFTSPVAGWRHQRAPLCHRSRPQTEEMNKEDSGESGVTVLRWCTGGCDVTGLSLTSVICTGSYAALTRSVTFTCTPRIESVDCVVEKPISCRHGLRTI